MVSFQTVKHKGSRFLQSLVIHRSQTGSSSNVLLKIRVHLIKKIHRPFPGNTSLNKNPADIVYLPVYRRNGGLVRLPESIFYGVFKLLAGMKLIREFSGFRFFWSCPPFFFFLLLNFSWFSFFYLCQFCSFIGIDYRNINNILESPPGPAPASFNTCFIPSIVGCPVPYIGSPSTFLKLGAPGILG